MLPLYDILGWCRIALLLIVSVLAEFRYNLLNKLLEKGNKTGFAISVIISLLIFFNIHLYPYYAIYEKIESSGFKLFFTVIEITAFSVLLFPLVNFLLISLFDVSLFSKSRLSKSAIVFVTLFFMFYVFLPCDSFINNNSEYKFSLQSFIFCELLYVIVLSLICTVICSLLKEKLFCIVSAAMAGTELSMYIQCLFLNKNLGRIDGAAVNWDDYSVYSIITSSAFILIIITFLVLKFKYKNFYNKFLDKIPPIILSVQFLSVVIIAVSGSSNLYKVSTYLSDGTDQYTVSSEKNVIMFILDATDNAYFSELLENKPEVFDNFNDFTMYTNTCSVYDSTRASVTQMLTGMELKSELTASEWFDEAWSSEKANTFFERFHRNNYMINGYYAVYNDLKYGAGKFDNYYLAAEEDVSANIEIDTESILRNFRELSMYRILPAVLKKYVDYEHINFEYCVKSQNDAIYFNDQYEQNLELKMSQDDSNYLIVEHLNGTHTPCTDFIKETEHLLSIISEYISQLKSMNLYNEAAIIITSDHGQHNSENSLVASTPILMVKKSGASNQKMIFSDAPVYHEDMQATLLDCAGLYDEEYDEQLFGRTIFNIREDERRTRTWYDRYRDSYREFTYEGDTQTLIDMVASGDICDVHKLPNYRG